MTVTELPLFDYVLVGGGMAAGYAVKGIREEDSTGTILMLSADKDIPYEKPALSKKLWTDDEFTEDEITIFDAEDKNVMIEYGTTVTKIDGDQQAVTTSSGKKVGFKKLLLATGGEPLEIKNTGSISDTEKVIPFRTWEDYRQLRQFAENHSDKHIVIIGGSYIGTELAANLSPYSHKITFVYPQDVLGNNRFPDELAKEFEDMYRDHGVDVKPGLRADSYEIKEDGSIVTKLDDDSELTSDVLVLGIGVDPELKLAKEAGLEVDDGVVVNEFFQTTKDANIFAAGDISSYPDKILGRTRLEHVDHARKSGTSAGKNMAGANEPYTHTPYFYSAVFDLSWEAIGTLDLDLDLFIDEVDGGKVVYYLKDDKPVGILTWNVEADLDDVRELLKNPPSSSSDLKGAIHE